MPSSVDASADAATAVELTPLRLLVDGGEGRTPEALWTTFVQRQQPVLRATARRITGDVVMADDAVQETLIAFWRHAPRLDVSEAAQVQAWLLRVVSNAARRQVRRSSTGCETPTQALAALPAHEPDEAPELSELRQHLGELPEIHRRVLELRFLDQRPYDEIARLLDVNEVAVRKRVDRALAELRLRLRRDGTVAPALLLLLAGGGEAAHRSWLAKAGMWSAAAVGAAGVTWGALAWWPQSPPGQVGAGAASPAAVSAIDAFIQDFQSDHADWIAVPTEGGRWTRTGARWRFDAGERAWVADLPASGREQRACAFFDHPLPGGKPLLIAVEVRAPIANRVSGVGIGWYGPRQGGGYPGGAMAFVGLTEDSLRQPFTWGDFGDGDTVAWRTMAIRVETGSAALFLDGAIRERMMTDLVAGRPRIPAVVFWRDGTAGAGAVRNVRVFTTR